MSRLILPYGQPGFNPSHIAGANVRFSSVAMNGNHVNIMTGSPGVISGTINRNIHGTLGENIATTGLLNFITFSGFVALTNSQGTIAGIAMWTNLNGTNHSLFTSNSAGNEFSILATSTNTLVLNCWGFTQTSTITLSANIPYFVVASRGAAGTYFLLKRLDTGTVLTNFVTPSGSPSAGGTSYNIGGSFSDNNSASCQVSAIMYSNNSLSEKQLRFWADDPWSFWYPQRITNYVGTIPSSPIPFGDNNAIVSLGGMGLVNTRSTTIVGAY